MPTKASNKRGDKQATPVKNPYSPKRSNPKVPINPSSKYVHKIDTAETKVEGVFVSWATKPNGIDACYVSPIKNLFFSKGREMNLCEVWKVNCIVNRRDPTIPGNVKLPGSRDSEWPWDAFVTIAEEGGDTTAEQVGNHIASVFTAFGADNKKKKLGHGFNYRQEFAFRRVASIPDELLPLSYYLLDEDVLLVFKAMYEVGNTKEEMMAQDDNLGQLFYLKVVRCFLFVQVKVNTTNPLFYQSKVSD